MIYRIEEAVKRAYCDGRKLSNQGILLSRNYHTDRRQDTCYEMTSSPDMVKILFQPGPVRV